MLKDSLNCFKGEGMVVACKGKVAKGTVRFTDGDVKRLNFALSVQNRYYKYLLEQLGVKKEDVVFTSQHNGKEYVTIRCVAWRQVAENMNKMIHEGSIVEVIGNAVKGSYATEDGSERTYVQVTVAAWDADRTKQTTTAPISEATATVATEAPATEVTEDIDLGMDLDLGW